MPPHISSTIVSDIYKSRGILCKQLKERGYDVEQYTDFSIMEISTMLNQDQLDMLVENENGKKCLIKYFIDKTLKHQIISKDYEQLFEEKATLSVANGDEIMYIVHHDPNDTLKKNLSFLFSKYNLFVSVYNYHRLLYNVLEHSMVPKHTKLNEEDKKKVYELYNILDDSQVPEISRYDPVSIAIGLRPGELCKIIRKSKTAIESDYYRICV